MSAVPRVSVVVPTSRRPDALPRTLEALERQTVPAGTFEVLVVYDPADDDPGAVAAMVAAPRRSYEARVLEHHGGGVSGARNVGWRNARAPLVLFLGDDIVPAPVLVAEHLSWHEREPGEEVAVLGHVRWARELRVTPFMRWLEDGNQFDYGSIAGEEASWAHFYACNASLKRSLIERAGGFDEQRFPFLYEELEMARRLADQGLRLRYNRAAEGEHLHVKALEDWRKRMAATAAAERRWVGLRPEMPAWFHDRLSSALAVRRVPPVLGRAAARVPRRLPVLGPRARAVADLHYRQELAPAFLTAWGAADQERRSSGGSPPGGPK